MGFTNNQCFSFAHNWVLYLEVTGKEFTCAHGIETGWGFVFLMWQTHVIGSSVSPRTPYPGFWQTSKDTQLSLPLLIWIRVLPYLGWQFFINLTSFWGWVVTVFSYFPLKCFSNVPTHSTQKLWLTLRTAPNTDSTVSAKYHQVLTSRSWGGKEKTSKEDASFCLW